ncbi:hypothetical protein NCS55_01465200 [Fusarium keratoplasticum]|nr:hypothetical protein NCS55_01465200 [Fusarium keratoplasticum]
MEGSRVTACDLCRLRKTRCNRPSPCSHCRQLGQECTFTGAGQKPKEPGQRIQISRRYERKIDQVENRLESMEALLAEIRSSMSRPPQQRSLSLSATPVPASSEAPRTIGHQEDMLLAVDGPSSLMAQIAMAKHLAENTIRPGHSGPSDSRISSRNAGKLQGDTITTHGYCESDFTVFIGGLYYLFNDCVLNADNASQTEQYLYNMRLCREALDSSLATASALLPACMQSVRALVLGSSHAIETSKPWVAWRLIGFAAHLCLALGYHDGSSMLRDDEETKKSKIHLFWLVYAAEKGLALRLGRPSIIRDGDITVTDDLHVLSFPGLWPEILDQNDHNRP